MSEIQIDLREIQVIGVTTRERVVTPEACPFLSDHGLGTVGQSQARSGFSFVRLQPRFDVLLACTGGAGQVWIEGVWQELKAGQAYLAPAGHPHAYRASPRGAWNLSWTIMHGVLAPGPARVLEENVDDYAQAIALLYKETRGRQNPQVSRLLVELLRLELGAVISSATRSRLERVWQAVDARLEHPWTLEELAQLAHLSTEGLRQRTHIEIGRSPMRQVTHLRMQRASYLLRMTSSSIETVALAVGFENAFAFSTAFKRWSGRRPSDLRLGSE
jgi:AraC-like DNA-binding protein